MPKIFALRELLQEIQDDSVSLFGTGHNIGKPVMATKSQQVEPDSHHNYLFGKIPDKCDSLFGDKPCDELLRFDDCHDKPVTSGNALSDRLEKLSLDAKDAEPSVSSVSEVTEHFRKLLEPEEIEGEREEQAHEELLEPEVHNEKGNPI